MSAVMFLVIGIILSMVGLGVMLGPAVAFVYAGMLLVLYALLKTCLEARK